MLGFVDVAPVAKGLHAFGNVTTGLKSGISTTTIKGASKVGLEEGGSRLKQADNLLTERAQNANRLSGEKFDNLSLNIEKKTPVENAPVIEKKSATFFDELNLKSDAKTVELGAGDAERIISEAYKEKLEKWAYPPSKEKYTKYKEIYDNPKYYNQETGDINWPPNNGFEGTPETVKLEEGMLIDRFGGPNGGFFSPAGEPYEARALALHSDEADYYVYRILDDFDVLGGKAAPWFDRPGGATQFVKYHDDGSVYTIQEFIDEEFIELVSVKKGDKKLRIDDLIMYLGNDFVIDSKEEQGKTILSVYTKDSYHIDLDTRLELVNLGDSSIWTLFQVQRDQFFQLSQFQRKDTAMLAIYISVKGKFEQLALDNSVKEKLRSMSNDTEQLQNILEANVESKYFSLIDTKMGAINLYKTGEKYDVVYLNPMKEKIWISKERKLPHAVVIVYNFSSKLQEFDKLIESVDIEKALSAIEIESLKRIYIGK